MSANASHLLELAAQVNKQKEAQAAAKLSGQSIPKPPKKRSKWAQSNKGVASRAAKDLVEHVSKGQGITIDNARETMERKAKLYDAIVRGKVDGKTEEQLSELVDFTEKRYRQLEDASGEEYSDEDDDGKIDFTEEKIEITDEMGRTRMVTRSEMRQFGPNTRSYINQPGEQISADNMYKSADNTGVIRGGVEYFPDLLTDDMHLQNAKKLAQRQKDLEVHYDTSRDAGRYHGAGHTNYGTGEARKERMAYTRQIHEQAEQAKAAHAVEGTVDDKWANEQAQKREELKAKRQAALDKKRKREEEASQSAPG